MAAVRVLTGRDAYLYMVWPLARMTAAPAFTIPPAYQWRYFQPDDTQAYCALVNLDGWRDAQWQCTERSLRYMIDRALPNGFFLVEHRASRTLVATAMARHRPDANTYYFPYGGEICLVFVHPEHRRQGLGRAMTAAVLNRLLTIEYPTIYLNVIDGRLPALRLYLTMGFVPLLYTAEVAARWQTICTQLHWPYTPNLWPQQIAGFLEEN